MSDWSLRSRCWLAGLGVLAGWGCSDGSVPPPALAQVTGTLLQDEKPLPGAMVVFEPDSGGAPSAGMTDEAGRFELRYREHPGAVPGKHVVRISKMEGEAGVELVAPRFNQQSQMTREVVAGRANDFKIEI